ncbi:MAG: type 4a pilus biogenesis protein PilO [Zetaproteobacteria bacterium]|nr:MAG: type 4a pilus biogenesis protein PilO [Zetaproteobacteria bacterium]
MPGALNISQLEVLRPILPFPLWQKAAVLAASFVLILVAYVYLGWMPLQDNITRVQRSVAGEQMLLAKNLRLAKDLPRKKKEFAKLEKQLKVALNMLPKKSQIPDLLEGVTRAGTNSGLEFSTFKPLGEINKQFYAEVPVNLSVTGSYRQLATFLKRVGQMPRIVDVKNLTLEQARAGGLLTVKGKAVTYRFIEAGTGKKKTRKGRR